MRSQVAIAMVVCLCVAGCKPKSKAAAKPVGPVSTSAGTGPSRFVNTFMGTDNAHVAGSAVSNGGGGSTFPGASAPFGMVQWSPDTPNAAPAGYFYPDNEILGFSLTHLDGAGCQTQRDFPMLPVVGKFDSSQTLTESFSHANEIASTGFYEVTLDSGVKVDLTATQRTGLARFTFPASTDSHLLLLSGWYWDVISELGWKLNVTGPDSLSGSRTDTFCGPFGATTVYMSAQFDRPFASTSAWGNGNYSETELSGLPSGLSMTWDTTKNPIVHMRVGLSYVSAANAAANLAAENPGFDFDSVHSETLARWDSYLGLANAQGGTEAQSQEFYSALYHVFLQPEVFSDVNGEYFGFDHVVHPSDGRTHYANFSGWDIYRSWIQLVSLLLPQEASDMVQSLVLDGEQGGAMPKWAYGASETGIMVGDSADPIVSNAYAFGATNFDTQSALTLMLHGANDADAACNGIFTRPDVGDYTTLGFCPIDAAKPAEGVAATTLEYSVDDFSIAQFAQAIGQTQTASTFLTRGLNWKNVFDPSYGDYNFQGYMQPRFTMDLNAEPQFQNADVASSNGFVEGSAAQYTWFVPQDLTALDIALGGDSVMIARLDALFTQLNAGTGSVNFYAGNEPDFEIPWEYPWAGAPWRTQAVVNSIIATEYSATPGGLPGNEDLGAMSSWLVWAMLGIYPEVPGVGGVVLGSPTFPRVDLTLSNGAVFTIKADNAGPDSYYVQSLQLNGITSTSTWVPVGTILGGGTLEFSLGSTPNMSWGSSPLDRPPATYQ